MIHWAWALVALYIGIVGGFFLLALLAAGASEHSWRCGYSEGREEGFQAGVKSNES